MTEFAYTMMCGQSPPDALVADIRRAEEAGFTAWAERELLPALRELQRSH